MVTDDRVPHQLLSVAKKVDAKLESVLDAQHRHWSDVDGRVCEAVDELRRMTLSGGKRLRAGFCYWSWRGAATLSGSNGPDGLADDLAIDVGAAFEFLQVFALIHDDIMDNSATRRGATTVHVANAHRLADNGWHGEPRRYGEGVAILVGDLGHVYADQLTGESIPTPAESGTSCGSNSTSASISTCGPPPPVSWTTTRPARWPRSRRRSTRSCGRCSWGQPSTAPTNCRRICSSGSTGSGVRWVRPSSCATTPWG